MSAQDSRTQALWHEATHAWRLLVDPAVPGSYKVIPILAVLYLLSPIDIVPDVLVGPGQLDDIAILLLALRAFVVLAGNDEAKRTATPREEPPTSTVTTTYRVADEDA